MGLTTLGALARRLSGRVTYRQLDHWVRATPMVNLGHRNHPGSGRHRLLTAAEAAALEDLVNTLYDINSGAFFRARLAHHRTHGDQP